VSNDTTALLAGTATTGGVCVPIAVLGSVVLDADDDLFLLLVPFTLVAFFAGGAVAGWYRPASPTGCGALAAAIGFALAQVLSYVLRAVADEGVIKPGAMAFAFALAAVLGASGGRYGALRRSA
jgi:hypothetical protein